MVNAIHVCQYQSPHASESYALIAMMKVLDFAFLAVKATTPVLPLCPLLSLQIYGYGVPA